MRGSALTEQASSSRPLSAVTSGRGTRTSHGGFGNPRGHWLKGIGSQSHAAGFLPE